MTTIEVEITEELVVKFIAYPMLVDASIDGEWWGQKITIPGVEVQIDDITWDKHEHTRKENQITKQYEEDHRDELTRLLTDAFIRQQ